MKLSPASVLILTQTILLRDATQSKVVSNIKYRTHQFRLVSVQGFIYSMVRLCLVLQDVTLAGTILA